MGKEPEATFSTCFGAPFMTLHPKVYARLLREKIEEHKVACWLVNTGWSGGPFGVGQRMKIAHTRALVHTALAGSLAGVPVKPDPIFRVEVPTACEGIPAEILTPRNTWADQAAYDATARQLAARFQKNFEQFTGEVAPDVRDAGPAAG
jgi:phosphoenolpyruvate carboxykinase (ATP)